MVSLFHLHSDFRLFPVTYTTVAPLIIDYHLCQSHLITPPLVGLLTPLLLVRFLNSPSGSKSEELRNLISVKKVLPPVFFSFITILLNKDILFQRTRTIISLQIPPVVPFSVLTYTSSLPSLVFLLTPEEQDHSTLLTLIK